MLDLNRTEVKLPDAIGQLTNLKKLVIGPSEKKLPAGLGELTGLEELDLHGASWSRLTEFPEVITRLKGLKRLDISGQPFPEIPASITRLTNLEELNLNGTLTRVKELPDLSPLKKLTTLGFNGSTQHSDDPSPAQHLIKKILHLETVEHLRLDRWGKEDDGRPALKLDDDTFSKLTRLKSIDLSFNDLTTLPKSFFELPALEEVNLEYNHKVQRHPLYLGLGSLIHPKPFRATRELSGRSAVISGIVHLAIGLVIAGIGVFVGLT